MKDINELHKINQLIARRFSRIEANLAGYSNPLELLAGVVVDLKEEFQIPYVWLTLVDGPETARLKKQIQRSEFLAGRLNCIGRPAFLGLVPDGVNPVIANAGLKPYYILLPTRIRYFIRSICVAPITCRGMIIGSFNHGDSSPLRYQPGMDHRLLARLMGKVSERLTELVPSGRRLKP